MDKVAKENKLPMRDVSEILRSIYFVPYIVDVTESNKQIGTRARASCKHPVLICMFGSGNEKIAREVHRSSLEMVMKEDFFVSVLRSK